MYILTCKMFKSRPGDQEHSVAMFPLPNSTLPSSVASLSSTGARPRGAGPSVFDWIGSLSVGGGGRGGPIDFVLLCCREFSFFVVVVGFFFAAANPYGRHGDVEIAQCSTGLESGAGPGGDTGLNQTRPDQIRQKQSSFLFFRYICLCKYVLCIYYVFLPESWLAANCRGSLTLLPETQGRAFHLFITTRCQLHLTPTLSYILYIHYM